MLAQLSISYYTLPNLQTVIKVIGLINYFEAEEMFYNFYHAVHTAVDA